MFSLLFSSSDGSVERLQSFERGIDGVCRKVQRQIHLVGDDGFSVREREICRNFGKLANYKTTLGLLRNFHRNHLTSPFFIHPTEEKASLGEILKSISRITVRCFSDLNRYNDSLTINIREHFGEALYENVRLVQYLQYFIPIRDAKTKASHS
jgi:hypothetical protein